MSLMGTDVHLQTSCNLPMWIYLPTRVNSLIIAEVYSIRPEDPPVYWHRCITQYPDMYKLAN